MTDRLQVEDKTAKRAMLYAVITCIAATIVRILFVSIVTITEGEGYEFIFFDNYNIVYYALDYSKGFITRGLAGQLFGDAVMNMGVSAALWMPIIKILYSFCFYAIAFAAMKKHFKTDNALCVMIAMMFMRPFYLNSAVKYVIKTDIFWYACMVPILIALWSDKKDKFALKMMVVLVFSAIAMLFHQAFIFVCAPLVCAILLDKKETKWLVVYGLAMCVLFVFLSKFCTGDYNEIKDMVMSNLESAGMLEKIMPLEETMLTDDGTLAGIYYEYGDSRFSQLIGDDYNSKRLLQSYIDLHIPMAIFLLGICNLSLNISITAMSDYCKTVLKSKWKSVFLATMFVLPFIALLIFTIDAERWFLMILTCLNIFTVYIAEKHGIRVPVNTKSCNIMLVVQFVFMFFIIVKL